MKNFIDIFAGLGIGIVILWVLGSLGIGHFEIYYGAYPRTCIKVTK